jgi:four helix bundle protein
MRDYTKINAWRFADELTVSVYEATRGFPREELYGIISQLRRASASVAANIAEGSARATRKDYLHFLHIARGSLTETQYFIHLSKRLGYLEESLLGNLQQQTKSAFACLHGLIRAVEKESAVSSP